MTFSLIIWGVYNVTRLPIDAVPDITNNQVQIITVSPSLGAQEVERLISFPVELSVASIPGITEVRSFSRFGLSLVTVVFEEDTDIYWGRQQITEKLKEAETQIPAGAGTPTLAPVSTGLGEIYQYELHAKKGFEHQYSPADLRTIQDWIVRRQLLGTPGVAEVSSFGGKLKQYEVAVQSDKLRALGVTITEVFNALEKNNANAGGAYIEKDPSAYFIRTEGLLRSQEEIRSIVVKNGSAPILIRDVADVREGSAIRYGAMVKDDQGEVAGGIVMMLKGENSSRVIKAVKDKIEAIRKTLPEGVAIEPFLDRTKLVDRAISTVQKNLAEGALIVVFVLVILLGNFRAGMLVASVIPLSMLFAISLMNVFGVSGNLMSLGALDFGLIVDGAVIIIESVIHRIQLSKHHHLGITKLSRQQMDNEVYSSASKMMGFASFGQIIILIVYLPILALVGIEGKMFKPMAQTVAFAILGAFLLSLTYVPMMASLFLSRNTVHKENFADRLMKGINKWYQPLLGTALKRKVQVLLVAIGLFVVSLFLFTRMGGEFIPSLDEGDFAIETRVLTGSSLNETIDVVQKASAILKNNFPEVEKVVTKIGSAEVPTEPNPIELGDMIVVLKPHEEWTSAGSREELANKISAVLEENLPQASFGVQQPIQMRFNELMTGARQDVVVKIYGEDLDTLANYAAKLGKLIEPVKGAQDLYVEKLTGLPQIMVQYNRENMARYGFNVEEVNRAITTAFAGEEAGEVYEGEKRFGLVVRLANQNRKDISDVQQLYVSNSNGMQIPLDQLASVQMRTGPNQIQRDGTRRRITVGFNVRNRDVQSIVDEIQAKEPALKLPPGYAITYGGQFENLIEAKKRLSVAVPLALLLIFVLLYFAFRSVKQSVLIFAAIPLSAIGGIFALLIRDMPFSISAGVGFIALFGVAVLNGIVMIGYFNQLKAEGINDTLEIIHKGTAARLRPIIMTATVASLGFLPMALSTSAGAEVQKPLATVVIGGLISATLLTLIVLPVIYYFSEEGLKMNKKFLAAVLLLLPFAGSAQTRPTTSLEEILEIARKNNQGIKKAKLNTDMTSALQGTAVDLPKTSFSYSRGEINSPLIDDRIDVRQSFSLPGVWASQKKVLSQQHEISKSTLEQATRELEHQVSSVYSRLSFLHQRSNLLEKQDALYAEFEKVASLRVKTGETGILEKTSVETERLQLQNTIRQNEMEYQTRMVELNSLVQNDVPLQFVPDSLKMLAIATDPPAPVSLKNYQHQVALAASELKLEKSKLAPELSVGYFNQSIAGTYDLEGQTVQLGRSSRLQGAEVGISIPVFWSAQSARIKAAGIAQKMAEADYSQYKHALAYQQTAAKEKMLRLAESLQFYQDRILPNARLAVRQANLGYRSGETGYLNYLRATTQALQAEEEYLKLLLEHQLSVYQINFLGGSL